MKFARLKDFLPAPLSVLLSFVSAVLLVLAFPDFEFWPLAWVALVPLLIAVEREKESKIKSLLVGWTFGTVFFFGSCWWLTFAPINYGGIPAPLAYFLLLIASLAVGFFPALFALTLSVILKRFGLYTIFAAPFVWTAFEFARFWITGNNWNAIAYSQAFDDLFFALPGIGGIYLVGFTLVLINTLLYFAFFNTIEENRIWKTFAFTSPFIVVIFVLWTGPAAFWNRDSEQPEKAVSSYVVAVQPNVPMSGLTLEKYAALRRKHVELAESALAKLKEQRTNNAPTIVIFPESPMNFMYTEDLEFQDFVRSFALKHDVSVLFNAAEPDAENDKYFNSAVMVDRAGNKIAQYDKIYLVPFGEAVPAPLQNIVPALVGSFSYGREYDLVPFGDAKAGIMICFESHFPNLSRQFVRSGADVLIEMTNDGYLGPTPVLRQHLASAVFRAVETNRPVLRATNVGITAYIDQRGRVHSPSQSYTEDTQIWTASKSDGSQTFYVKYGDWFAWLSVLVSLALLIFSWRKKKQNEA